MLRIVPLNDVLVRVECDDAIAMELSEYFAFDKPGAAYMQRQQKYKHWDGKIRLFKVRGRTIYRGLIPRVVEFAEARGYACECPPALTKAADVARVNAWAAATLPSHLPNGQELEFRDYQAVSVASCLTEKRHIILSPTGSGKSLIIYTLLSILNPAKRKALLVVPTIGLVSQMVQDFRDYGYTEPIHIIKGGAEKATTTGITVSTWQSIYEMPASYFAQFKCVVVDEVHTAKSASLTGLMEKCLTVPYRFGFTGTIDNTECHRLVLEGLFGSITRSATTDELVKRGYLAKLKVHMCLIDYPADVRKSMNRVPYQDEIDFIVQHRVRNEFISRLVNTTPGNTLVLFQYVEKHGLQLFARIAELAKSTGRQVHYIAGSVDGAERERIRQAVSVGDNHIVVASYGTFQLGVNIPSLRNLVFAHPAKSPIRVLQSIGRMLRTMLGKTSAVLYDVVDDFRRGAYVNHCFKHADERINYYTTEKFTVAMKPINLDHFATLDV